MKMSLSRECFFFGWKADEEGELLDSHAEVD